LQQSLIPAAERVGRLRVGLSRLAVDDLDRRPGHGFARVAVRDRALERPRDGVLRRDRKHDGEVGEDEDD
jgi:hypothetical protein